MTPAQRITEWLKEPAQTPVRTLAEAASLACRLDALLLRLLRSELFPQMSPEVESDLWCSRLIESCDTSGAVFVPDLLPVLRNGLSHSGRLELAYQLTRRAHRHLSPARQLEESLVYLDLVGGSADEQRRQLQSALKAIVHDTARGMELARWADVAMRRMPESTRDIEEHQLLQTAVAARLPLRLSSRRDRPFIDVERHAWVMPSSNREVKTRKLAVRLGGQRLHLLRDDPNGAHPTIEVPESAQAWVQIRGALPSGQVRFFQIRAQAGSSVDLLGHVHGLEVSTTDGRLYAIHPKQRAAPTAVIEHGHLPLPRFAQADHTVFVSYARADNELCGNWVADFADEVKQQLTAALPLDLGRLPEGRSREISVHLSEQNGPVSGDLLNELRSRVVSSFAMVIVVHDSYLDSPWCLKELELFHQAFGVQGLDQRLYVLALSADSIRKLEGSDGWKTIFKGRNQVWRPFFQNDQRGRYIPVLRPDGRAASIEFEDGFEPIRRDLVTKIRRDLMVPAKNIEHSPIPVLRFVSADSTVFVSYAHVDNELCGNWVADFAEEVKQQFSAALARDLGRLPEVRSREITVHLGEQNGPRSGDQLEELRQRVRSCFAMVIVVHDGYLDSPWCLKELELFHQTFGAQGLDERLYVLALSADSIRKLESSDVWKTIFKGRNQVWRPFFQNDQRGRYIPVLRPDGRAASIEFEDGFEPIRRDLVTKIRRDLMAGPVRTPAPPLAPAEAKAREGAAAVTPGPVLFGVCRPELADAVNRLADQIQAAGQAVKVLAAEDLRSGFADFAQAQALVLPFNDGQPLDDDLNVGGHLSIQKRAWLKRKRPLASLVSLDLGYIAAPHAADDEHRWVIEEMKQGAFDEQALLARWAPTPAPASDLSGGDEAVIRLYIESNRIERREWKLLGRWIQDHWRELLAPQQIDSQLRLHPLGLPVDELDASISLDTADGFILLWGQKDKRSLLSQINKVEKQTREYVPGIVAFLSPPQPRPDEAVPALGWEVLRFECTTGPISIDDEDRDDLANFLSEVVARHKRRRAGVFYPGAA